MTATGKRFARVLKRLLVAIGVCAVIMVCLALTDLPFLAYHQLGTSCAPLEESPKTIVILGGAGMPSADGLIRIYYGAQSAIAHPNATVILAHPFDDEENGTRQLDLMARELIIRGVDSSRIHYEPIGFNTHSQAVNVAAMLKDNLNSPVLLITTPDHMYRSIHSFAKAGLTNTGGVPSFGKPICEIKLENTIENSEMVGLAWRYNLWSYLRYELIVLREYSAISYYKLKGWI
ncbi:YdcF family protein [Bacteroidota bacterium]